MRISGSEPSSVILAKNWKMVSQKCQNKFAAKGDGVINPQNYNFNQF